MKCPHCETGIHLEEEGSHAWEVEDGDPNKTGYGLSYGHCPACSRLIVLLQYGKYKSASVTSGYIHSVTSEEVIYPKHLSRKVAEEVPDVHRKDFEEACAVLHLSPKASAALSRRILQNVLREGLNIKHSTLAQEIEEFIHRADVPSYLTQAVDAVRQVGNFAAHPLKDTNTGQIVDVEPGEAEWLLDVNESLFDFVFVQPKRLDERKRKLNDKLKSIGKQPMKSK